MNVLFRIFLILSILFIIYIYLILPRIFNKPDSSKFKSRHYAHRGLFDNSSNAPENSLNAFRRAIDSGYGIELDVQLSKDGIPVVFHDASLKRMCGSEGYIWEFTLAQLKKMQLGSSDETIPTLEEALSCIDGRVPVIIEYKLNDLNALICRRCDKILREYKGIYCIESFNPIALIWYRFNHPDILRGQLSMNYNRDSLFKGKILYTPLSYLVTNILTRPDFISYKFSDTSNLSFKLCKKLGALTFAWTIKSFSDYEKASDKFDLFIFDSFLLPS